MKKLYILTAGAAMLLLPTSCIQEFEPQGSTVTETQVAAAPGSYDSFVSGLSSSVAGQFTFDIDGYQYPNDFGYPSEMLMRDVTGQDVVAGVTNNWFSFWYESSTQLAPSGLMCQQTWRYYYGQIKNCNTVISLSGDNPTDKYKTGAGIAYAWRALYYLDLTQMFVPTTYGQDSNAPTVPIVTESMNFSTAAENPRAPFKDMLTFILSDLDKAETYLTGYTRPNKENPDVSVVNGLRARAYLIMEDWANAEKYAKLAQQGYTALTAAQYTDRNTGFNDASSNNSWMLCCSFKKEDACMVYQTGNHSWGSWMIAEVPSDSYGYYATYGQCNFIDYHLYQTIPATDARKKCFVDFSLDKLPTEAAKKAALADYTDVPEYLYGTAENIGSDAGLPGALLGGMPVKFRPKNGEHQTNLDAWCVDVPMMRVEEMMLIEAEAAGRQDEARGKILLENFAKTRDANYVYGQHNEAYNNHQTSAFVNEIWWQRRVEFWGEGISMYDVKRLNKGIIRSYANTNHIDGYRWNTNNPPQWMTFCIVQTETNNNSAVINNPTPIAPDGNSPEHIW